MNHSMLTGRPRWFENQTRNRPPDRVNSTDEIRAGRARLLDNGVLARLPAPSTQADVRSLPLELRVEPHMGLPSAVAAATARATLDAAREEINTAKAIVFAEAQLADDQQQPSEQPVSDDWVFAWREYAGRVSGEDLQRLWGSVLAGEVRSPGSYSMRTLDFMRGLCKAEADLLGTLAKFAIGDIVARSQKSYLDTQGLPFGSLLQLQELGVLAGVEGLGLKKTFPSMERGRYVSVLVSHNKALLIEDQDPSKKCVLDAYLITNVGREVLSLGAFEPDATYLQALAQEIAKQGFQVQVGDWTPITSTEGQFMNGVKVGA